VTRRATLQILSVITTLVLLLANLGPVFAASDSAPLAASDPRFFSQTNFRIDNDKFWDYFQKRGGINNFGYPVSRTFTFLGATVQFFQRRIVEINPVGSVGQLNLLDAGLMPYNAINYATFPQSDPILSKAAPAVGSPTYNTAILAWIQANAPNSFRGFSTSFFTTFQNTVSLSTAYPTGGGNSGLLQGIELEMWGIPTAAPAADPNNSNFVYQRFQRGVMHYDNTTRLTQGLLLADYFKSIITGSNLPGDLAASAANSPYYKQYNNAAPNGLNKPSLVPNTNMSNAFEAQQPVAGTTPPPAPSGSSGFRYGFQAQFYGVNQQQVLNTITGAGFGWTKQQVRWLDVEPNPGQFNWGTLDSLANAAAASGVKVSKSTTSRTSSAANSR
jgi:hypothetical protein